MSMRKDGSWTERLMASFGSQDDEYEKLPLGVCGGVTYSDFLWVSLKRARRSWRWFGPRSMEGEVMTTLATAVASSLPSIPLSRWMS